MGVFWPIENVIMRLPIGTLKKKASGRQPRFVTSRLNTFGGRTFMARKYLDDIGITIDKRPEGWDNEDKKQVNKWKKEQSIFGFDSRETWSLDYTFYLWLYERLMHFRKKSSQMTVAVDFKYKGQTMTYEECIEKMIKGCILKFQEDDRVHGLTEDEYEQVSDVTKIWAFIIPYMWW